MVYGLIALAAIVFPVLLYVGRGYWAWVAAAAILLLAWHEAGIESANLLWAVLIVFVLGALIFGLKPVRQRLISRVLMGLVGKILPQIGETERIALDAGTVWWDGELFSGKPNWQKLIAFKLRPLSGKEQAFMDGPVEELCVLLDDWQITQDRGLPDKVWDYLKGHGFFGMVIPEHYGGLGFSAIAHSAVITKLASRSSTAAVVVMVPNSLGPGELLVHYGTDEQKAHYLPRLATGEEIPCFALTEPEAGSDAAATSSIGVVAYGDWQGAQVLGMRLNWHKRYITLAPVATVIGLAFRLTDPDGLLGERPDLGITCALIPRDLSGVEIGDFHDPMGVPFPNGPIFGRDVFVPLSFVIGGEAGIGQGWRMVMEALAAGRSISLPSLAAGSAQLAVRIVAAYGTVREQFNLPIGRFEGVEEVIARIGGKTYLLNATRILTCGAVDAGERPAVLTAIAKAYLTDIMRDVVNDAMDIRAGSAICRGPKNILSRVYAAVPIGITVEGANILTRSLIVYGQGAIRSHPFVRDEMEAIAAKDVARFDAAFFSHVNFAFGNLARVIIHRLTLGLVIATPVSSPAGRYYRQVSRFSAGFALVSDVALAVYGGRLKREEKISGRFADALAWLYMGSATLKRFHDEGSETRDIAVMSWAMEHCLERIETALRGILDNFANRPLAWLLTALVFGLARRMKGPSDRLGAAVAGGLLDGGALREPLSRDIFVPSAPEEGLGNLEAAFDQIVAARPTGKKVKQAVRSGKIDADSDVIEAAINAGIISAQEGQALSDADVARRQVIQVDVFDPDTYRQLKG